MDDTRDGPEPESRVDREAPRRRTLTRREARRASRRLALACVLSIVLTPFSAVAEPPATPAGEPPPTANPARGAGSATAAPDAPAVAPGVSVSAVGLSAPTFVIEKIVVEGVRHGSQGIVAAETLLTQGKAYSEPQLQEALHRVERLPFVVEAGFSLRRGTERGRFELLITVTEAKPMFFGVGLDQFFSDGCSACQTSAEGHGPGLGARVFFAGQSELSAGLRGFGHSGLEGWFVDFGAAYTYHNLLDRHVAGTVAFSSESHRNTVTGQLAFPLSRAQVLTVAAERASRDRFRWYPGLDPSPNIDLTSRRVGLSWRRDTTDDPFTPRRGTRIGTALTYTGSDYSDPSPSLPPPSIHAADARPVADGPAAGRERALAGLIQTSLYRPLSQSLSLGFEANLGASLARADGMIVLDGVSRAVKPNDRGVGASLGAALLGRFPDRGTGRTQFWWTLGASFSHRARWRDCDPVQACDVLPRLADRAYPETGHSELAHGEAREEDPGHDVRIDRSTLSLSIAARGRWGTVSLGFHYRYYFNNQPGWPW